MQDARRGYEHRRLKDACDWELVHQHYDEGRGFDDPRARQRGPRMQSEMDKAVKDKIMFTKFKGESNSIEDFEEWANKMDLYFEISPRSEISKVYFASLHLEGFSHTWWRRKQSHGYAITTWEEFKNDMAEEFTSRMQRDNHIVEWDKLEQVTTMKAYSQKFLKLLLYLDDFDEHYLVVKYIRGLKTPIGGEVKAQEPATLKKAMMLAKIHEKYVSKWASKGNIKGEVVT